VQPLALAVVGFAPTIPHAASAPAAIIDPMRAVLPLIMVPPQIGNNVRCDRKHATDE
jgi:hypothetical protein